MKNKHKQNHTLVYIARVTAKTVVSAFFFSIALVGNAAPAFANDLVSQETAIIGRTNQVRAEVGLPALNTDSRLMRSAAAKAADMASKGYFAHADANGNRMNYWIQPTGYVYSLAGENIAMGYSDISRLMNAWIASPTHYKNLVEAKFTDIGVGMATGFYQGQETLFIAQHFGAEATQTVKDISRMTAVIAPLIEQVAGATETDNIPTAPVQSTPFLTTIINQPIAMAFELPEPPAMETAQILTPPTTGGVADIIWPLWAFLILAAMGYIIDERFILMVQEKFSRRAKA